MHRHRLTLWTATLAAAVLTITPVPFMAGCTASNEGEAVATTSAANDARPDAGFDTPPRPVTQVSPEYPESAKESGLEGKIWVRLTVGADGLVQDAVVEQRSDESAAVFDDAALAAARKWTFEAATYDQEPVKCQVIVPIAFALS